MARWVGFQQVTILHEGGQSTIFTVMLSIKLCISLNNAIANVVFVDQL